MCQNKSTAVLFWTNRLLPKDRTPFWLEEEICYQNAKKYTTFDFPRFA